MTLTVMPKLPLGGVDRRALVQLLATHGPSTTRDDLERDCAQIQKTLDSFPQDHCVLLLGGSTGILRAVALQLIFGEAAPVYCIHYDSEKLQIGPHHARAIMERAEKSGRFAKFVNGDATNPEVIANTVADLKKQFRVVHVVNGIASGATKRSPEHGPTTVPDLDVAFDSVRQTPDFSKPECIRKIGLVEVSVAVQNEIDRTHKMMGTSTNLWTDALSAAKLLVPNESTVSFADYDFEPNDPVYAKGPLASAKVLQRQSMDNIHKQHNVLTVRLCYPAMNTTALGTIPGGLLMFAGTAELLFRKGKYKSLATLAKETMPMFAPGFRRHELRVDQEFVAVRPEFHSFIETLNNDNLHSQFSHLIGKTQL